MSLNKFQTAAEIAKKVLKKDLRVKDVVSSYLNKINNTNFKLNAVIHLEENFINQEIERVENLLSQSDKGELKKDELKLAGVPVLIKDNIACLDRPLTCASKILKNYKSPYDATVVKKLKKAGAIILATTNMDEFAMGSSNETSVYGAVRNPWDISCVPGGSSGGAAAAVAAGFAPLSLGSDTGGSIRQPASFCGVFGLKPTYGLVSRQGLVAFASSLDQIGPIAFSTEDLALSLEVLAGSDFKDSTNNHQQENISYSKLLNQNKKTKIALIDNFLQEGVSEDIINATLVAEKKLIELGYSVERVSLNNLKYVVATYYIIATAEASANLARFDGIRYGHRSNKASDIDSVYSLSRAEGFGFEVKKRILLGTYVLSAGYYDAFYTKAKSAQAMLCSEVEKLFESYDILLGPTTPTTAFELNRKSENPLINYLNDIFTIPANLAGLPALSLPNGYDKKGLPIGLQLMAKKWHESELLSVSYAFEQATKDHIKLPECYNE